MHRNTLRLCAAVCAALAWGAHAQSYPTKPVRVVVPFAPGGTTDFIARVLGKRLTEELGQTFVVDNRGGAGGTLGTDIVAKAPGDGYTLLVYHIGLATAPSIFAKLPYDTRRDIAPISQLGTTPSIMVVHPSVKVSTVKDLVAMARAAPGEVRAGTAGVGSSAFLSVSLFEYLAKVKLTQVPYKGGAPALLAMVGGETQVMIQTMPDTIRQVRAGKLKLIAVSTAKRVPDLPDTPTIAESGVPGYDFTTWFGMFAPGTMAKPLVTRLNQLVNKHLANAEVQSEFRKDGLEPGGGGVEEFRALVNSEIDKWAKVMKATGIKPN
ncbi:MAG TPA: tripartite tricarboxylate transporter substrate binding protein [Burkholderiales bacterium]|nr:tripartite tricarboxylate transporter substrate binding protein [Burkholderiales bacterium]